MYINFNFNVLIIFVLFQFKVLIKRLKSKNKQTLL